MLKIGIVGLSQSGKTTLFRILTHTHAAGLASGKPEAHVAVVRVPDARLDRLEELFHRGKIVHATLEYTDTPADVIELVRTGTQAAMLREVDALAHVVRAFESPAVPASSGRVNPRRDVENVELELMLSDLAVVEKRLDRLAHDLKKQKSPVLEKEVQLCQTAKAALEKQTPLRGVPWSSEDERAIRGFAFLSFKPMLYVFNLGENEAARATAPDELASAAGFTPRPKTAVAAVCGEVEAELAELTDAEAAEFLASYGLKESAIARLIRSSYQLLGLISFFTVGETECRAWTIRAGATTFEAAGAVHSDFQKKFVRAEVAGFDDLVAAGGFAEARTQGRLKVVGKEYVLHDGEVVYFRHSG